MTCMNCSYVHSGLTINIPCRHIHVRMYVYIYPGLCRIEDMACIYVPWPGHVGMYVIIMYPGLCSIEDMACMSNIVFLYCNTFCLSMPFLYTYRVYPN